MTLHNAKPYVLRPHKAGSRDFAILAFALLAIVALTTFLSLRPYLFDNAFIGHADQANAANLARNIAEGKGAVVDNVWIHAGGGLPGGDVTHPEPYWSVYMAFVVALFFKVFDATRAMLVLPAALAKGVLVGVTGLWAWQVAGRRIHALAAMVVVAFSPLLLRSVSGFSDLYLAAGMLGTVTVLVNGLVSHNRWVLLLAGLLCGFTIGFKLSGLLLLGLWPVYLVYASDRRAAARALVPFLLGCALALTPYFIYNKSNFGSWFGATSLAMNAGAVKGRLMKENGLTYAEAHNEAFYNPSHAVQGVRTSAREQLTASARRVADFVQRGLFRGEVIPLWLLPFALAGAIAFVGRFPPRARGYTLGMRELYLLSAVALFVGGLVLAAVTYFEPRYWGWYVPLAAVAGVSVVRGVSARYLLACVMVLAISFGAIWYKSFQWQPVPKGYEVARKLLPPGAAVFTSSPWQFAFHTRIPAVSTPYTSDRGVVLDLARRYDLKFMVVVGNDQRHAFFRSMDLDAPPPPFRLFYKDEHIAILEIVRP